MHQFQRRQRIRAVSLRGSVSVEMAIVAPILIFLLFGIIEVGWLLKDDLILGSACREAARAAAVGRTTTEITTTARAAASSLNAAAITVGSEYLDPTTATWVTLTNTAEGRNSAPVGCQIKVTLTYPHDLVCGPITSVFADPGQPFRTLRSRMVSLRN